MAWPATRKSAAVGDVDESREFVVVDQGRVGVGAHVSPIAVAGDVHLEDVDALAGEPTGSETERVGPVADVREACRLRESGSGPDRDRRGCPVGVISWLAANIRGPTICPASIALRTATSSRGFDAAALTRLVNPWSSSRAALQIAAMRFSSTGIRARSIRSAHTGERDVGVAVHQAGHHVRPSSSMRTASSGGSHDSLAATTASMRLPDDQHVAREQRLTGAVEDHASGEQGPRLAVVLCHLTLLSSISATSTGCPHVCDSCAAAATRNAATAS